jgi:hypothetical protein
MHVNFSEWFRAANLEASADSLPKRWAGVDTFQVGKNAIVSLVEVFFGFFDGKDAFLAEFRTAFQAKDSTFRMRDNNRELSVLAGATLVTVMEDYPTDFGDAAALALLACAAQNLRGAVCVPEIPELAVKHLATRSIQRNKLDADEEDEEDEVQKQLKQLRRDLEVISEESNILWWVFGESSRDLQVRWSQLSLPHIALVSGKELSDLSRISPGPAAAFALLDRITKFAKGNVAAQITIKEAISDCNVEWRRLFVKTKYQAALANLTPISHGIKLSIDLADSGAWAQTLATSLKVQRGGKLSPTLISYQTYLECRLATVWLELE